MADLVVSSPRGLYCAAGDFYIDPWQPVDRAVITHAHADHLRAGNAACLLAAPGEALARHRLRPQAALQVIDYGEPLWIGAVKVSLHPAGHILGSAQVRIEHAGEVWVVTGDFKRETDPTCAAFEPLRCHVLVSEATFALPIYRWDDPQQTLRSIHDWWQQQRERGEACILYAYALGKAQRLLAGLQAFTDQPVLVHGAVGAMTGLYRAAGVSLLPTLPATGVRPRDATGALVIAPPSASGSPWVRRFGRHASGYCSGWMRVRGNRRRRGHDRGFVLSDHADWPALLRTFAESGAQRILLTHGHGDSMVRYLRELGLDAATLPTDSGREQ